jgi:hypothetical protein
MPRGTLITRRFTAHTDSISHRSHLFFHTRWHVKQPYFSRRG